MKHLGDITKIRGSEAPVVDVVIGGSPCQDLSLAGKRAGLAGARSGLYMEQIRIIKEMREADVLRGRADVDIRPRYMVWENVPGAFSTNGGKDFAAVIEEAIRVAEPEAPNIPVPKKGWPTSGCFWDELGGWSVAWRVLDAQFWGVPQRRRRIALVADFGGLSAPEILFVRKSVSGNIEPGKPQRKETAGDTGESSCGAIGCDVYNFAVSGDKTVTLNANSGASAAHAGPTVAVPFTLKIRGGCSGGGKGALIQNDKSATLSTLQDQTLFQPVTYVTEKYLFENHSQDARYKGPLEASHMLSAQMGTGGNNTPIVVESMIYGIGNGQVNQSITEGKSGALNCMHDQNAVLHHIIRRLTPMECERLQGFPDGWTDIGEWVDSKGKLHKEADSPRYKALGNSIAIPPWKWVLKKMCSCYERDATMASLFDGIGGFPYIWEQLNGKGSCLWASEIEEFPMAVTKLRFGG